MNAYTTVGADKASAGSSAGAQVANGAGQGVEAFFGYEELFYSRTDKRGVIQAGNDIFQRVAGFEWSELLGAPHRIVRHPDMPRGVFRILWDAIQKGHSIGAYVKNRTHAGDFYWVFAIILPIEDGYLSVRLKPSSEVFDRIKAFYADLVQRERREGLDPEASAHVLRDFAAGQGFSSYTSLMAYALGQEIIALSRQRKTEQDRRTRILTDMNAALEKATQQQTGLLRSFEALQSIPNNMRIVASRLEPSGGPVSAISENYKASSVVIAERLRAFVVGRDNTCDLMSREVARALFLLGSSRVISEMNAAMSQARPVAGIDWAKERELLAGLEESCGRRAREAMASAGEMAARLNRTSAEIRRQMLGLDTIRVLGRVECGRMRDANGGLSATIDQLDTFHADIKNRLELIMRLSEVIESSISAFLRVDFGEARA